MQLGETADPALLIPGSPVFLSLGADAWSNRADLAEQTSAALRRIGVPEGWTGAGADQFERYLGVLVGRWSRLANALEAAASALQQYISTLESARRRAQTAIDLWQRAQEEEAEARSATLTNPGLQLTVDTAPTDRMRQNARAILEDARAIVATDGDSAAAAIHGATEQPSTSDRVWNAIARTAYSSEAARNLFATLSASELTTLLQARPDLAAVLATSTPGSAASWWQDLNDGQQQALISGAPAVIGNLEGIAYGARDQANQLWLDDSLERARLYLARAEHALNEAPYYDAVGEAITRDEARAQLAALENIRSALDPKIGGQERFLLSLTSDRPPLAAVSIGNLDTADNVTYAVPGMGTTTQDMAGWTTTAQDIADAQERADRGRSHAVVAWIGYETPPIPLSEGGFDVRYNDLASAGAEQLDATLGGFDAVRGGDAPSLNVVAHSYGTTTAAIALDESDVRVDSFVSLGSAGLPSAIDEAAEF